MTVELRPEDQELIQKRLTSGAFKTAGEVIHDALISQDAEESWLRENQQDIHEKIQRGRAQLARGEGIPGDVSRTRLQERKAGGLAERRRP